MVRRLMRYLVEARSDNAITKLLSNTTSFLEPLSPLTLLMREPLFFAPLILRELSVVPLGNILAVDYTTSAPSLMLLIEFPFTPAHVSALFWFRSR